VPVECRGLDYRETRAVLVCSVPELTRGLQLLVMISIRILSDWQDFFSLDIHPSATANTPDNPLLLFSALLYVCAFSSAGRFEMPIEQLCSCVNYKALRRCDLPANSTLNKVL